MTSKPPPPSPPKLIQALVKRYHGCFDAPRVTYIIPIGITASGDLRECRLPLTQEYTVGELIALNDLLAIETLPEYIIGFDEDT